MTTVEFAEFDMADNWDALTTEGLFEKWSSFAGVQSFKFEDAINTFESSDWTTITNVTYGATLRRSGSVGADHVAWYSQTMPHSYTMEFTAHEDTWEVYVRGDSVAGTWYRIGYSAPDELVTVKRSLSTVEVIVLQKELQDNEIVDWGRVKISVRDAQSTSDSPIRLVFISLWINDELIITYSEVDEAGTPPLKMGFTVYAGSTSIIISDFRIANLGEIITISSLDPGEKPIGAIQRAIEDRYIKYWVRWDGSLFAWSPTARENIITLSPSRQLSMSVVRDTRQIINHIRVLGAFQWVQVFDWESIAQYGHRFRQLQNTSVWDSDDCKRVGDQMLIRGKEQASQARISTFGLTLLELEDRVQMPNVNGDGTYIDYIIDSISWQSSDGLTLRAEINGRRYYYGEP